MSDKVALLVGEKRIENFTTYSLESDIFTAADTFMLEFSGPGSEIARGARCKLYVNGVLELNGVIDSVTHAYDKSGSSLRVEGRDLMGLLVDSYVEEFITLEDVELRALAERLLAKVPFINRKAIKYMKGNKLRAVELSSAKEEFEFAQLQPGQTVFDALKSYAMSRGMLFFALPDGTFVFGEPRTSGAAEFRLVSRTDGRDNNVLRGSKKEDVSGEYSKVTVVGQRQGSDILDTGEENFGATVENHDLGFYKPFVVVAEHDGENAKKYARILMDKQRFEGFSLEYSVAGHSQDGRNWQVNAVAHVLDEQYRLDDDFLIYGRAFERSKDGGTTTRLRLSRLGVLPA